MAKKKKTAPSANQRQPNSRKNGYIFQLGALGAAVILAVYLLVSGFADHSGNGAGEPSPDAAAGNRQASETPADGGAEELPPAPITVEPQVLHFGEVSRNTTVTGEVTLTNTSSSPVRIVDTRPSCPCTKTTRHVNTINPGHSVIIGVEMDTESRVGPKTVNVNVLLAGYNHVRIPIQATVQ